MALRDPDDAVVALFKHHAIKNEGRSAKEGRPIYDDMEIVEVRFPGSRSVSVFPATAFSHWQNNPETGEQTAVSYAERFSKQYRQFKGQNEQTKAGTPLAHAPFLTEARRAELRALNIYTVEQLSVVDGQELKNLGHAGRDLKNRAIEYISESKNNAPTTMLSAELEALRARNAVLEEDNEALKKSGGEGQFKEMTTDQIRDYVTAHTGQEPIGNMNRKALVRMALEARPDKAA